MPTPNIPPPDPDNELGFYWVSDELRDAYWLALGQFFDTLGSVESTLSTYITRFVARKFGKDDAEGIALARALLGRQRSQEISDTVKRLLRVTNADEQTHIIANGAFQQFGLIVGIRNRIVHQGASPEYHEGKWTVRNTNQSQVRESGQIEEIFFTIEDLEHMARDLGIIQIMVRVSLFPELGREFRKSALSYIQEPSWHYKSSEPERNRQGPRASGKGQQRQPRSSEESARQAKLDRKAAQRRDPRNRKKDE
jgi:hypothetical protein